MMALLAVATIMPLAGCGDGKSIVGKWQDKAGKTYIFASDGTGSFELSKAEKDLMARIRADAGMNDQLNLVPTPFTWKTDGNLLTLILGGVDGLNSAAVQYEFDVAGPTLTLTNRHDRTSTVFSRME